MIFLEYVGSRACLSATKGVNQIIVWFTSFFYTLFYILGCKMGQRKNLRDLLFRHKF